MGVDLLETDNIFRSGFIGSYGNRWSNKILAECDLLIVIGSRLDIRQTGSDTKSFSDGKEIWQLDIDKKEIGLRIKPNFNLNLDVLEFNLILRNLIKNNPELKLNFNFHSEWINKINKLKSSWPPINEYKTREREINPLEYLTLYSQINKKDTIYVTDVGQHQMWAAQSLEFGPKDRFITSGGMGAMGFGLPAAIGAAFNDENKEVVLITGDGSFQVNIQELQTIKRNNLNIKIILFNNKCHGMVRQFQESYFGDNLQSTSKGYSAPNFMEIAKAYSIDSELINKNDHLKNSIRKLIATKKAKLVEIEISNNSKVYPKLAFGRKFGEMEPEYNPKAMEST